MSQQGLLISVRSGVNARPSRRLISRPSDVDPDGDRAKSATLHALNLISLRMPGKAGSDVPFVSMQLPCSQHFFRWLRNWPANGREALDPCRGTTPGRNDSRCAGIGK